MFDRLQIYFCWINLIVVELMMVKEQAINAFLTLSVWKFGNFGV